MREYLADARIGLPPKRGTKVGGGGESATAQKTGAPVADSLPKKTAMDKATKDKATKDKATKEGSDGTASASASANQDTATDQGAATTSAGSVVETRKVSVPHSTQKVSKANG
jgi:hypothetical protein